MSGGESDYSDDFEEDSDAECKVNESKSEKKVSENYPATAACTTVEDKVMVAEEPLAAAEEPAGPLALNKPLDHHCACELRNLLFQGSGGHRQHGNGAGRSRPLTFNAAWRKQNFGFCNIDEIDYGLIQHEGGPCGVMAAVQAEILHSLLWRGVADRGDALRRAIATILARAARGGADDDGSQRWRASVVSADTTTTFTSSKRCALDSLRVSEAEDEDSLLALLERPTVARQLTDSEGGGAILFVASLLLSRGLKHVAADIAAGSGGAALGAPSPPLIDRHAYCAQEMVNLMLTGRATGQVFDGTRALGSDKHDVRLVGIARQSDVGLLTLVEAYGHVEVGARLKNPVLPIWVVCSESHYSVVFSREQHRARDQDGTARYGSANLGVRDGRFGGRFDSFGAGFGSGFGGVAETDSEPFDLEYYDGLAGQNEQIRLTLKNDPDTPQPTADDEDALTPPLDLVLRTRWRAAAVDWNDTEPIL